MHIGIDARSLEQNQTGVGRYLSNLLQYWAHDSRHHFTLYFKNKISDLEILDKYYIEKKILKTSLVTISSNALFQHWLLPCAAKKDKVDLLFSPAYILPLIFSGKTAVTIHDVSFEAFPENLSLADLFFLKKVSFFSAKKADVILTVSNFSKNEIIKYYNISEEKIFVLPLGADKKILEAKKIDWRKTVAIKFSIGNKFILSVGTIFNRRHIENLINAFATIKKNENYQLIIIGKNYTKPFVDIDKIIQEINIDLKRKAILHYNSIASDDLASLYIAAEAMVYLSDYEGFGLPPLEAALAQIPVITSDIPAIREVMGNAAIFIKNNTDTDEIKQAIIKIISERNFRDKLVQAGLERVKLFSWSNCAKKTMEIFEKNFNNS